MKTLLFAVLIIVSTSLSLSKAVAQSANYSNWEIASSDLISGKLAVNPNQTKTFSFSVTIVRFLNSTGTDYQPVNFQFALSRLPSGSQSCGCTQITNVYTITSADFPSGANTVTKNFTATVTAQSGSSLTGSVLRNNDKILLTVLTGGPWAPNKNYSVTVISNNTVSYSGTTSFVGSGDPDNIVGSTPTGGTGSYTYQWQSSTTSASSGFSNVASATALSYDPPTISLTTYYRRVVTSGGVSSNSNVVTITISALPISNNSISNSGNSTLYGASGDPSILNGSTPTGGSGTYTYQWQSSTTSSSSGFSNIASAASLSYDPPSITQTTHYRRVVTSGSSSTSSNVITINLRPLGSNFENPIDLGTVSGSSCQGFSSYMYDINPLFSDSYGTAAVDIYYKFTLLNSAEVEIGTCNELHSFPLYLFDSSQTLLEQAPFVNPYELGGCENGSLLHRSLSAGTYYIISSGLQDGTFTYPYALSTFININCRTFYPSSITQTTHYRQSDHHPSIQPEPTRILNSSLNYLPESNSGIIYPNPAKQYIQFKIDENTDASVQIVGLNGVVLDEAHLTSASSRMDISNLPSGLYMVRITQNNIVHLEKVFVQK